TFPIGAAGAVTWSSGTAGVTGAVSAANSLVGSSTNDQVGSFVTVLANGNYVVSSRNWDNGGIADAGAVTFGDGTTGVTGSITTLNSAIGATANTGLEVVFGAENINDTFFGRFVWEGGGRVRVGSQVSGFFPNITVPAAQTAYEDVDKTIS